MPSTSTSLEFIEAYLKPNPRFVGVQKFIASVIYEYAKHVCRHTPTINNRPTCIILKEIKDHLIALSFNYPDIVNIVDCGRDTKVDGETYLYLVLRNITFFFLRIRSQGGPSADIMLIEDVMTYVGNDFCRISCEKSATTDHALAI